MLLPSYMKRSITNLLPPGFMVAVVSACLYAMNRLTRPAPATRGVLHRLKLGLIEHPAPPLGPTTSPAPHAEATQQPGTSTPSGSGPGGSSGNVAASGPTGPAAQSSSDQGAEGAAAAQEWVEVRPRWPLTSEYHPRRAPDPWNARKARMHTSLTDLTAAAVAAAAAAAPAASQPVGGAGSGP